MPISTRYGIRINRRTVFSDRLVTQAVRTGRGGGNTRRVRRDNRRQRFESRSATRQQRVERRTRTSGARRTRNSPAISRSRNQGTYLRAVRTRRGGRTTTIRRVGPRGVPTTIRGAKIPPAVKKPRPRAQIKPVKPVQPFPKLPAEKLTDEQLDISNLAIINGQYTPVDKNGITPFRPEIIMTTNFSPIYRGNQGRVLSSTGKLIEAQFQALYLRRDTLIESLGALDEWREDEAREAFSSIRRKFRREIERTERTIEYYNRLTRTLDNAKSLIDLKRIAKTEYDLKNFKSLDDFFEDSLQYSKPRQEFFTTTKMFNQLIADSKEIAENYSFSLLNLVDNDRTNDVSPIDVDNTYTLSNGFNFTIESIRSETEPENATEFSAISNLYKSLPVDPDDRVKLLINTLSKEWRVSRNLSQRNVAELLSNEFGAQNTGSPFNNIFGVPGDTILDNPEGPNSLSSLSFLSINDNAFVLPFESKFVDDNEQKKTFIPGANYFFDSILQLDGNNFNTEPYIQYSTLVSNKIDKASKAVRDLFELRNQNLAIQPQEMYKALMTSVRDSSKQVIEPSNINKGQVLSIALFKLANADPILKAMLFQFLVLLGISANTRSDTRSVFRQVGSEIENLRNLSYVRPIRGRTISLDGAERTTLLPYLELLAQDIENRVIKLNSFLKTIDQAFNLSNTPIISRELPFNENEIDILSAAFNNPRIGVALFNKGDIKDILLAPNRPKPTATTDLFKEFFNLAHKFTIAASRNGNPTYLLDDFSGRTRYNFLSTSMQLLLLFETMSSYIDKYGFARFIKSNDLNRNFVAVDIEKTTFLIQTLNEVIFQPGAKRITRRRRKYANIINASNALRSNRHSIGPRGTFKPFSANYRKFMSNQRASLAVSQRASKITSLNELAGKLIINSGLRSVQQDQNADLSRLIELRKQIDNNLNSPVLKRKFLINFKRGNFGPLNFQPRFAALRRDLFNIREKLVAENRVIANIVHLLDVFSEQIQKSKEIVLKTFNQNTLNTFLEENSINDLDIIRNPSQVRTAAFLSRELSSRFKNVIPIESRNGQKYQNIVVGDVISPKTKRVFDATFARTAFREGQLSSERLKIVSVGVPAGFSKALSDRISVDNIRKDSFFEKQSDVVTINVHKRDNRYDDLVFKPRRYVFDLSLFAPIVSIDNANPRRRERYRRIRQRTNLLDYQSIDSPRDISERTIVNDDSYNFLTNQQKTDLINNHITSKMLELYINFVTGLRIREDSFLINDVTPGQSLNEDLEQLFRQYISEVLDIDLGNRSIPEIINDPEEDDGVKDILRLFTFGSVIFEPNVYRAKSINSKLFDRVFHIAVPVDGYEIDVEATNTTNSGKLLLQQDFLQRKIVTNPITGAQSLQNTSENEIVFSDFFITLETNY